MHIIQKITKRIIKIYKNIQKTRLQRPIKGQMELIDLPHEIQKHILDRLDEKDHVSMHRVSKSWRFMIVDYLNDKHSIKSTDWKWFCRHEPQIARCSECLAKIRNKTDAKGLENDWNWWI